eukprot:2781539-Pyramimonas_sp.AAC.1
MAAKSQKVAEKEPYKACTNHDKTTKAGVPVKTTSKRAELLEVPDEPPKRMCYRLGHRCVER